jgi:hypothetical protein
MSLPQQITTSLLISYEQYYTPTTLLPQGTDTGTKQKVKTTQDPS